MGLIILIVFLFLFILSLIIRPLMSYLSRPNNLTEALVNGKVLANQSNKIIITVTAHPDDAEWYAGGTLARLAKENKVILVLGTSGEKGAVGDDVGEIREAKQKRAGEIIGYDKIIFLGHRDRGLKNNEEYREELTRIFNRYDPEIVFTFDPSKPNIIYRHSDHMAAGQAASEVAKRFKNIQLFYFHSRDNNVAVEFAPEREKRREALRALSGYGSPPLVQKILHLLSPGRGEQFSYGYNQSFPSIGIKNGEVFRKK